MSPDSVTVFFLLLASSPNLVQCNLSELNAFFFCFPSYSYSFFVSCFFLFFFFKLLFLFVFFYFLFIFLYIFFFFLFPFFFFLLFFTLSFFYFFVGRGFLLFTLSPEAKVNTWLCAWEIRVGRFISISVIEDFKILVRYFSVSVHVFFLLICESGLFCLSVYLFFLRY